METNIERSIHVACLCQALKTQAERWYISQSTNYNKLLSDSNVWQNLHDFVCFCHKLTVDYLRGKLSWAIILYKKAIILFNCLISQHWTVITDENQVKPPNIILCPPLSYYAHVFFYLTPKVLFSIPAAKIFELTRTNSPQNILSSPFKVTKTSCSPVDRRQAAFTGPYE